MIGLLIAAALASGPSFDCGRARLPVEALICADSDLSALDRQLSEVFQAVSAQGGGGQAGALRHDEDVWLTAHRNLCAHRVCLARAYTDRIAELRARSLRRASPSAYDETRPFGAPASASAAARRAVGSTCGWSSGLIGPAVAGFGAVKGAMPITLGAGTVVVRQREGARFAFLVKIRAEEPVASCKVVDAVALPPTAAAPAVLQCTAVASAGAAPGGPGWFAGFGIRKAGQRDPMGFWVIRPDGARLQRVAINTLGLSGKVRCQAPEVGD